MPLPLDTSKKAKIIRRAKALAVLSLPFLAFVVIVFAFPARQSGPHAPMAGSGNTETDGLYALTAETEPTRQAAGSTSVTTYTVTGTY
jgi:hypothetical protein